jgi:hypothetical protein
MSRTQYVTDKELATALGDMTPGRWEDMESMKNEEFISHTNSILVIKFDEPFLGVARCGEDVAAGPPIEPATASERAGDS